jgi:hypothetical protein
MSVGSLKDVQVFTGVMDGDSEKRFIKPGDYLFLINGRTTITNDGNNFAVEDVEGNLLIDNLFIDFYGGVNKCIGACDDKEGQSIVFMVWNSLGHHGIYRYFVNRTGYQNGVIEKIWQVKDPSIYDDFNPNPLNFSEDELITGINLIDNLLLWACFNDQPKQMDIVRANETGKLRKFNFYINQNSLDTQVDYAIGVVDEVTGAVAIPSILYTSNKTSLSDRVADLTNQINSAVGIGYIATSKFNYIEVEIQRAGDFMLVVNDNYTDRSRVLPANFYQYNIPGNYFYRIQAPPFCRPNASFTPQGIPVGNNASAVGNGLFHVWSPGGGGFIPNFALNWFIGITSEANDVDNIFKIGPNINNGPIFPAIQPGINPNGNGSWNLTNAGAQPSYNFIQGFFSLGQFTSINMNISMRIRILANAGPISLGDYPYLKVVLVAVHPSGLVEQIQTFGNSPFIGANPTGQFQNYSTPYDQVHSVDQLQITNIPGVKYTIWVTAKYVSFEVADMSYSINGPPVLLDRGIVKQASIFRARYEYENYQKSVYGQSTSVILRTENYNSQYDCLIKFNDKFIESDFYASRLRRVFLAVSDDNGTTWYDFEELEPYQFVCENNRDAIYNNKKQRIPIDTATAILQFHALPIRSKSQEFIDDRVFDGGIVEGYSAIPVDFDVEIFYRDVTSNNYYTVGVLPISLEGFKPRYSGYIGIVYYDDFDRKGPVCIGKNSKIDIPGYLDIMAPGQDFSLLKFVFGLKLKVYNEPPSWATKYRLVRTRDFSNTTYLLWMISFIIIVNQDDEIVPPAVGPKFIRIYFNNLAHASESANRGAVYEYTYEKSDRVRIYTNSTQALLSQTFDVEIVSADADSIYINYDPAIIIAGVNTGSIIEIYSKSSEASPEDSLFYEMGECFEIKTAKFGEVLKKYHTGNDASAATVDQSYPFTGQAIPAALITFHGGAYYRTRQMYRVVTVLPAITWSAPIYVWVCSNFADEYILSKFDGLTRPNTVLEIGQVNILAAGRYSNKYISGSQINGLNEVEPLSSFKFPTSYGLLIKMQVVNNDVLRLVFSNGYQASLYISQGVIRQSQDNGDLISTSDAVAQNSHKIQRTLGTINPESVTISDEADLFGYDENEGIVWRGSSNGLIPVSDYKQKTNFKNWSSLRKALNRKKAFSPSVYDQYHDEYILTLNPLAPAPEVLPHLEIDIQNLYASDVVGPGGLQFTVSIEIISPASLLMPPYQVPPGSDLHTAIILGFNQNGWNATKDPISGKIKVVAPDQSVNNKSIVITVITNESEQLGPELVKNGNFLWSSNNNEWTGNNWFIDPLGISSNYAQHLGLTADEFRQIGLGLKSGSNYRTKYSALIAGGTMRLVMGDSPQEVFGNIVTGNLIDYTQDFSYIDNDDDVIKFVPAANFVQIFSVSVKELTPNQPKIFTYKINNGSAAQSGEAFPGTTIAFNKNKNGWPQQHSFVPEMYGKVNDTIVAFKDGKLWLHTTQAIPKNYFGVQYARELQIVCNKDFPKVKEFKAININGFGKNSCPAIIIPPYEGVPTGMETELTLAHFSTKEGIQYAAIQKDKLTPGFTDQIRAWINGRSMKGQVIIIPIVNNEPVVSLIYSAEILYFYSENS